MVDTVYSKAIRRAAAYCGGLDVLARRIGVSRTRLGLYAEGLEEAPIDLFLAVVDILLEQDMAQLGKHPAARDGAGDGKRRS